MAAHNPPFATASIPERIHLTQELEQLYKEQQEAEQVTKSKAEVGAKVEHTEGQCQ